MTSLFRLTTGVALLGACALKGDVRRVEDQVVAMRDEAARTDSVRAAMLDQLLAFQQSILDSLNVLQRRISTFQGDVRADMTEVQRQLVQLQELSGQSQQRLAELRAQIDARMRAPVAVTPSGDTVVAEGGEEGLGAQELYDLSLQQLRRGSPQTARLGFGKLLADFPEHPLAPDALFFIGESWEESEVDSAAAVYDQVVQKYRDSRRAPTALFRLGLIAERRGNQRAAQLYYQRVIAGYPRSEEAQLARTKLGNPGTPGSRPGSGRG
ncbi:MAG: tetratricopeptide repeat protein [Gemmatimonadales bacterium]